MSEKLRHIEIDNLSNVMLLFKLLCAVQDSTGQYNTPLTHPYLHAIKQLDRNHQGAFC